MSNFSDCCCEYFHQYLCYRHLSSFILKAVSPDRVTLHLDLTTSQEIIFLSVLSDFTVHIFVNHDPFIASVFLPELFAGFPDSSWQLPPEISPPHRPEVIPTPIPQALVRKLLVDPRQGLGRHVFPEPISSSTTLRTLLSILEKEFGVGRDLVVHFTIFPHWHMKHGTLPKWHDRPLPWEIKLSEAATFDYDATIEGQYIQMSDQYAPVMHLVVETKAAALKRILGARFMESFFGAEYKYQPDMWKKLESFDRAFPFYGGPEIATILEQWRHVLWSLKYLTGEKDKVESKKGVAEIDVGNITNQIESFHRKNEELKSSMSTLVHQWEEWV